MHIVVLIAKRSPRVHAISVVLNERQRYMYTVCRGRSTSDALSVGQGCSYSPTCPCAFYSLPPSQAQEARCAVYPGPSAVMARPKTTLQHAMYLRGERNYNVQVPGASGMALVVGVVRLICRLRYHCTKTSADLRSGMFA